MTSIRVTTLSYSHKINLFLLNSSFSNSSYQKYTAHITFVLVTLQKSQYPNYLNKIIKYQINRLKLQQDQPGFFQSDTYFRKWNLQGVYHQPMGKSIVDLDCYTSMTTYILCSFQVVKGSWRPHYSEFDADRQVEVKGFEILLIGPYLLASDFASDD